MLYSFADFEILGFPSNQFAGQEPGSNEQIKEFACTRFKAEFPLFDKVQYYYFAMFFALKNARLYIEACFNIPEELFKSESPNYPSPEI
jgi:hypothetical protein